MTDIDPSPDRIGESTEGDDRSATRGRRRPSRGTIALVAALLGAAIPLTLFGAVHLFATAASGASVRPGPGDTSTSMIRSAPPVRPLATSAIAAHVDPGLVDISVSFGLAHAKGAATGMVLTPSGEVLTNNHVIAGATSISVRDIGNGRTYSAHVVGYDRTQDVAVLQVQGAVGLQTVPLGDSSRARPGQRVTALGNAGGLGGTPKVARGRIVALNQAITASDSGGVNAQHLTGLIETDAGIRPGDSGGPLVNDFGQVMGMDAAASAHFTAAPSPTQGYAIPINAALSIARQIEAGRSSAVVHVGPTGFLGVEIVPPGQPGFAGANGGYPHGALVGGVLSGFPAQRAGLSRGDVITRVDGQTVTSPTILTDLLSAHHPGDVVRLTWVDRSGRAHTMTVRLASGPSA